MSEPDDTSFAPRKAADLIGQDAAEAEFLAAYNAGRMPHAWLIAGPRGVGKATFAYRIARFILSEGADGAGAAPGLFGDAPAPAASLQMAPEHPVFRRVASGGHSDLRVYERTVDERTKRLHRDITVDEIRGVGRFLALTPAEGNWRVVVIDSADDMNANAANAVLKILEEPPARALLLLISHEPGRLLPTIRSRCRRLWLGPLDEATMRTLLQAHHPELGEDDAAVLVELARGSIGAALKLADQGGVALFRDVQGVLAGLPRLDLTELHRLGDKVSRDNTGETMRTLGELVDWVLVSLTRSAARVDGDRPPLKLPPPAPGTLDRWIEVWEKTQRLFREADSLNLDRKQVVLETFLAIEEAARP